jgi:hypothetical protein
MKLFEITPKQRAWIDKQSPALQALIEKRPYNLAYRYKPTGDRALLISYSGEAVNLAVNDAFDQRLLGISPDAIEEMDVPDDQILGAPLTEPAKVFAAVGDLARAMS